MTSAVPTPPGRARPPYRGEVRAAVFDAGRITVERLELPPRATGELDIEITAAAICGSDLHTVLGRRPAPPRLGLGHEGVGRVGPVGPVDPGTVDLAGAELRPGDRVVFGLFSACGTCDRCTARLEMKCRSLLKLGHESVNEPPYASGTLATAIRLPPGVPVLRVPDALTDARAVSAGCAVATAAAVVEAAGPPPAGAEVLQYGAGAVGVYCAAMLTELGCTVHVEEPATHRLEQIRRFGGRPAEQSREFATVIEASGSTAAFAEAVDRTAIGGRLVAAGSVSPGNGTAALDPALLVTRRLTLIGVHNYTAANFRAGVDWLIEHAASLRVEQLLSPPIGLDKITDAFDLMRTGRHPRVLIDPTT